MFYYLGFILFVIGIIGVLKKKNIIEIIICIELILLSISIIFVSKSYMLDDINGIIFSLCILAIAGAESAIGLGLIVKYNKKRNNIMI